MRSNRGVVPMGILIASHNSILIADADGGSMQAAPGFPGRHPTCIAWDRFEEGVAWCGTRADGVYRSGDGGRTWRAVSLAGEHITALTPSPLEPGVVWAGTEPSVVWRSSNGRDWRRLEGLADLPSSADWSFPPKPHTHHVRWIAHHPIRPGYLWIAIEAGALIMTPDGGRTWRDRVRGGPWDTHELAIHPDRPESLHISAGDGYFESDDGGSTWSSPSDGLEVGYLRSVAIDPGDPDVVVVSAATHAHAAYIAGRSDGRVYRRSRGETWHRVLDGWPDPPRTIAPLLAAGRESGEFWGTDERGLHQSRNGGRSWRQVAEFPTTPDHLRGLAVR